MVRSFIVTLVVAPVLSFSASAYGVEAFRDSVGVQQKNGKLFVQHKVDPKETLYALSRKYNVPVAQIVEANPNVQATIRIGEIVLIPRKGSASSAVASVAKATPVSPAANGRTFTVSEGGNKMHVVEARQTLYSISRIYGVSVDDIRRWNGLADNSISIGSSLIVGKGDGKPTKKPLYTPEADDEMVKQKASDEMATTVTTISGPAEAAAAPVERTAVGEGEEEESASAVAKIMESGMAEMIDPKADTNKYLALHRSAPVGTIMQVKNAANGQVVYVRVIGKLPNTAENNNVIVRISKKACQKLGATDSKFKVDVSYMP